MDYFGVTHILSQILSSLQMRGAIAHMAFSAIILLKKSIKTSMLKLFEHLISDPKTSAG